jgi:hypothetical protein
MQPVVSMYMLAHVQAASMPMLIVRTKPLWLSCLKLSDVHSAGTLQLRCVIVLPVQ